MSKRERERESRHSLIGSSIEEVRVAVVTVVVVGATPTPTAAAVLVFWVVNSIKA